MKKVSLTFITILICTTVFAQKTGAKSLYGIKGGLNISSFNESGTGVPSMKNKFDYNVGGFVEIKTADNWYIQPEIVFSKQGANFSFPVTVNGINYNTDNTFNLYYINIPVTFKYYASKQFCLEAGPQISFLTEANLVVRVVGRSNTQDAAKLFKSNDFGMNIGASCDITKNLFLNVRYTLGLSNIAITTDGENTVLKNNVIAACLGVKF